MADRHKLLYVVVQDVDTTEAATAARTNTAPPLPRYTRPLLQSTLQLMGCKPRHAFKVSDRVFDVLRSELPPKATKLPRAAPPTLEPHHTCDNNLPPPQDKQLDVALTKPTKTSRKRSAVTVTRDKFLDVVCEALEEYQYVGPNQRADLMLACRVRERKTSVTILLCGTSGCGKSTLSSLLASRLGITTVVSTDSVRHMLRSFADENENPLLWASTYHAGDYLDPEAVAKAKAKKKAAKMASLPLRTSSSEISVNGKVVPSPLESRGSNNQLSVGDVELQGLGSDGSTRGKSIYSSHNGSHEAADALVGSKTMAVQGFKAQSEMVIDSLDRLITAWEHKCESVVVEGVHLSLNFVMGLMKRHPSVVPFMVYIANEGKHLERFAVRAKYMTLDPARNKYVKYIRNIRIIQEYLCKRADKHLVPKVNNTNVDKSVAAIHATIFSSLRRREKGEPLLDHSTNTVKVVDQEYRSQYAASALGSKGMFQLIQRKGSSRNFMALMNVDGSVAKAWPIQKGPGDGKLWSNGDDREIGSPVYGPIIGQIGKVEPVNLQFGSYGLSAWPNDEGGTSNHGSVDGQSSRGDPCDVHSSYHGSSRASSPRGDGADKDLIGDEVSVSGSEEEVEGLRFDSDIENSDGEAENVEDEEIEGSVDEESIRSDEDAEEFELDDVDDGYWLEEVDERNEHVEKAPTTDNASSYVAGRVKSDRPQTPGISIGRSLALKSQRLSTNVPEASCPVADVLPKPQTGRGMEHLTIAVPSFDTRVHARSRSSTVR